ILLAASPSRVSVRYQLTCPQAPTGPIRAATLTGPSGRKSDAASNPRSNRDEPASQCHELDPWHQRPESIGPLLQVTFARRSLLNIPRSHDCETPGAPTQTSLRSLRAKYAK